MRVDALLVLATGLGGSVPPPRRAAAPRADVPLPAVEQDDEASKMLVLQHEYERYRAAVEQPLHNVDESTAQRTQAVRVRGLLSGEDIEALHRLGKELARQRPDSTIDRSAWGQPEGTWLVTFLNTEGAFEQALPALHAKVRAAALAVDRAHWNLTAGVAEGQLNYRVAEYHTMRSELDDGDRCLSHAPFALPLPLPLNPTPSPSPSPNPNPNLALPWPSRLFEPSPKDANGTRTTTQASRRAAGCARCATWTRAACSP